MRGEQEKERERERGGRDRKGRSKGRGRGEGRKRHEEEEMHNDKAVFMDDKLVGICAPLYAASRTRSVLVVHTRCHE